MLFMEFQYFHYARDLYIYSNIYDIFMHSVCSFCSWNCLQLPDILVHALSSDILSWNQFLVQNYLFPTRQQDLR